MALGYVYPAYECYKLVEMRHPDLEHLRFWCQYWYIFSLSWLLWSWYQAIFFFLLPILVEIVYLEKIAVGYPKHIFYFIFIIELVFLLRYLYGAVRVMYFVRHENVSGSEVLHCVTG